MTVIVIVLIAAMLTAVGMPVATAVELLGGAVLVGVQLTERAHLQQ
ncbi:MULTISPECIES: hypothetical protein [unclassified Streptomyces]